MAMLKNLWVQTKDAFALQHIQAGPKVNAISKSFLQSGLEYADSG